MSNIKLTKSCLCKGEIPECPVCEGTGIKLFDESWEAMHDSFATDEDYFNEEDS